MSSDFANFWQKHTPMEFETNVLYTAPHILFYVRTVPCKTNDASERTLRRRPLAVRLLIDPGSHDFFKSLYLNF